MAHMTPERAVRLLRAKAGELEAVDDYAAHASRCRTDTRPVQLADWRRRQLEDQWARTFRGRT